MTNNNVLPLTRPTNAHHNVLTWRTRCLMSNALGSTRVLKFDRVGFISLMRWLDVIVLNKRLKRYPYVRFVYINNYKSAR